MAKKGRKRNNKLKKAEAALAAPAGPPEDGERLSILNPDHPFLQGNLKRQYEDGTFHRRYTGPDECRFILPMLFKYDPETSSACTSKSRGARGADAHVTGDVDSRALGEQAEGDKEELEDANGEEDDSADTVACHVLIIVHPNGALEAQPGPPLTTTAFPSEEIPRERLLTLERTELTAQQISAQMLFTSYELWAPRYGEAAPASGHSPASSPPGTPSSSRLSQASPSPSPSPGTMTSRGPSPVVPAVVPGGGPWPGFWQDTFGLPDVYAHRLRNAFIREVTCGELESAWEIAEAFAFALLDSRDSAGRGETASQATAGKSEQHVNGAGHDTDGKRLSKTRREIVVQNDRVDRTKLWEPSDLLGPDELVLPIENILGSLDTYKRSMYVVRDRRPVETQLDEWASVQVEPHELSQQREAQEQDKPREHNEQSNHQGQYHN